MSMAQKTKEASPSGDPHCPNCKAVLPPHAAFCASCGERIPKKNARPLFLNETDISARYRITSLIRRRPYVNLFFAFDNHQQRPVAIREINIMSLDDKARAAACEVAQQEYDLLRREHLHAIMPVIDLQYFQSYLYVVAGWHASTNKKAPLTPFSTLQDVLQSGIGLPDMQVALSWIEQICVSLDYLHHRSIFLGDLDPQALILDGNSYESELALMVSWLPPAIRNMLSPLPPINNTTNFSAPEALSGKPEARSDIYSLGAVLYLLLTGIAPDDSALRMQHRLRSPGEVHPRISSSLDEFVMKALAPESSERFQSAAEMSEALLRLRSSSGSKLLPSTDFSVASLPSTPPLGVKAMDSRKNDIDYQERRIEEIVNINTAVVTPEKSRTARQVAKAFESRPALSTEEVEQVPAVIEGKQQDKAEREKDAQAYEVQASSQHPIPGDNTANTKSSFIEGFKKRVTGILPAIRLPMGTSPSVRGSTVPPKVSTKSSFPQATPVTYDASIGTSSARDQSLLKQLQQLVRGQQKHETMAAAIIETPLRVQPNQSYTIRIQLMGRNEAGFLQDIPMQSNMREGTKPAGLSALVEGELVYIEVRSALYQNYAYVVQQATVYIPAQGYAAEVTIPMQPLSSGPSGRRDRLHIFFKDEMHHPLYEKPFVVELFVSHLVQPGREGHNVLTIPL